VKKHSERIALEKEKSVLTEWNVTLRADNHKYAEWLPGMSKKVEEKLSLIDSDEIRAALMKGLLLDQIPALILNMQAQTQNSIDIPETGLVSLDGYFAERKAESVSDDVSFKVMVDRKLDYLTEKNVDILGISQLVANNVSNAFRELKKSEIGNKEIFVRFRLNESGNYQISIYDNAHEFDLSILVNLGVRGNSTNGSGFGWADTMELLSRYNASICIREFKPYGDLFTKEIAIIFDGKNERLIDSYRKEEILPYLP